jgi:hypothetical protein
MYKPIWGLIFKYNGSRIQFNSIQFSQEYSNQRKMRKDQTRTQDVTEFGLKMPTSPGLSTSNNWGWAETLKNNFTLIELGLLQKWAAKPIDNKSDNTLKKGWVTTHSKQEVSDNTLKKVSTTAQERWAL